MGRLTASHGAAATQRRSVQPVFFVQELMRFVDILDLRRTMLRYDRRALLVTMTPCLVDAIAERLLGNVPHQVVHPPFDGQRVAEAMRRVAGAQEVPLVVVEVECPEQAGKVAQAVAGTRACFLACAADLAELCRTARSRSPAVARRGAVESERLHDAGGEGLRGKQPGRRKAAGESAWVQPGLPQEARSPALP